jgi:hypothetical protein
VAGINHACLLEAAQAEVTRFFTRKLKLQEKDRQWRFLTGSAAHLVADIGHDNQQ